MRHLTPKPLVHALIASTALWLAAWLAVPLAGVVRTTTLNVGWSLVCFLAGAIALARARDRSDPARRALALLGLGTIAWGLGQVVWTWYELVEGAVPYPSAADVGYSAGMLLLAGGVVAWPRRARGWRPRDVIEGLLVLGVAFLFSFEFVLGPALAAAEGATGVLLAAYPVTDVLLFSALVTGLLTGRFDQTGRIAVLLVGLVTLLVADTGFALAGEAYTTGGLFDAGWTLGFAAVGLCAALPRGAGARLRLPGVLGPARAGVLLACVGAYLLTERDTGAAGEMAVDRWLAPALFGLVGLRYATALTGRLREETRLRELQLRLATEVTLRAATLEASRTGICVLDATGAQAFANSRWSEVETAFASVREALLAPGGSPQKHWDGERCLVFTVERLGPGELVLSADDVTVEERERRTRDRFLAQLVRAQDDEARRIAELLHDDAVQRLSALSVRLELEAMRSQEPGLGPLAAEAGTITAGIRKLLVDLHPAVLESRGLGAAVESAARSLREQGIEVTVAPFDVRLAPEHEQLAYRVLQEALANAAAHASPEHVEVACSVDGHVLRCTVDDDGIGLDAELLEEALGRGGFGLRLVAERLELAGGSLSLSRSPAGGTRFSFELAVTPLAARPAGAGALAAA